MEIRTVLPTVGQDVRFALRLFTKSLLFTLVALLTLGVGIGANTAIFTVIRSVLLKPLPYPHGDRLAIIWSQWSKEGRAPASGPEFVRLQERSHLFEELAGIWITGGSIIGNQDEPEHIKMGFVTYNFPSMLSARLQVGRFFTVQEQGKGAPPVAILTHGLWVRRFGSDPGIIGKSVRLNGGNVTVVGVMPADFRLIFPDDSNVPADVDLFTPFAWDLAGAPPDQAYIRIIGRLDKGATFAQAQSEADGIAEQLRAGFKEYAEVNLRLHVFPLHFDDVRNVRGALLSLFAGVGLVLLIGCANVANLLLARSNERQNEITLRAALGAARSRIARQLLTESVLLACLGGVVALGIGWGILRILLLLRPAGISRLAPVALDLSVLAFTFALSMVTGIIFGLAPALASTRTDLVQALKEGARASRTGGRHSRRLLVAAEVALGFTLLIGSGLMVRTFASVLRIDPGFQAEHALTFHLSLAGGHFSSVAEVENFLRLLQTNLTALPGVQSVGAVSHLPLDSDLPNWYSYYWGEGTPAQEQNTFMADHRSTLPGYFRSMGATLIAGRDFTQLDDAAHPHVVIVDDTLARQVWPNQDPIGKKLNVENGDFVRDWAMVVGVVRHIQSHSLTRSIRPQIYLPYPIAVRMDVAFVIRATGDLEGLAVPIRREVAKLDKNLPVSRILPMTTYVDDARAQTRFVTFLAGGLAGVALLLACTGIFGVTTYLVVRRRGEIGVRMALGAQPRDVLKLIFGQGMTPVLYGLAAGALLSLELTPMLAGLLYGVHPDDPTTFAAISILLLLVAGVACYVPALRAIRTDPAVALRCE